jgi:hypothetical protein
MFESNKEDSLVHQISLSLLTTPVLFGLITLDVLTETVQELGEVSEEIFRGDRLPILNVSEEETPT